MPFSFEEKENNKNQVRQQLSLARDQGVDKISLNWQCSQDNIKNIVKNGQKYGGQCKIDREGYLIQSEMTVTNKCNDLLRRDMGKFVQAKGEYRTWKQKE